MNKEIKREAKLLYNEKKSGFHKMTWLYLLSLTALIIFKYIVIYIILGIEMQALPSFELLLNSNRYDVNFVSSNISSFMTLVFKCSLMFICANHFNKHKRSKKDFAESVKKVLVIHLLHYLCISLPVHICFEARAISWIYNNSILSMALLIIMILSFTIFSVLYYFSCGLLMIEPEKSIRTIVAQSFSLGYRNAGKILSFALSFLPWLILEFLILFVVRIITQQLLGNLSVINDFINSLMLASLSGVGFFFYPYYYTAKTILIMKIADD